MLLLIFIILFTKLEALNLSLDNNSTEINSTTTENLLFLSTLINQNLTEIKNETQAVLVDEPKYLTETTEQENSTTFSNLILNEFTSSTITTNTSSFIDRCLNVECPITFPDCPIDSVPILNTISFDDTSTTSLEEYCCSRVECKCDIQKCFIPKCLKEELKENEEVQREEKEGLILIKKGNGKPSNCCDEYKCINDMEKDDEGKELFLEEEEEENNIINNGCHYEDHIYLTGEHWNASPCQECECSPAGVALCRRMECPSLSPDCQWIGLSPGECCPVCLGCRDDNGNNYLPGSNWNRDDGCTNCTCGSGGGDEENFDYHWQCQKFICKTECEWPRQPIAGKECCPVCEDGPTIALEPSSSCLSLIDCKLNCQYGLKKNYLTGCYECKCAEGEFLIEENRDGNQDDDIPTTTTSTNCQPLKDLCLYNDNTYNIGEHFEDGPFRNCSCLEGGMLKCKEIYCPPCDSSIIQPQATSLPSTKINNSFEGGRKYLCLTRCLMIQQQNEEDEQQKFVSFEKSVEEQIIIFFDNTTTINDQGNNTTNKQLNSQQKFILFQSNWLFIIIALILVGIPVISLILLFGIYLLFNSKYRHCRKERNIEHASNNLLLINNKKNKSNYFLKLLPFNKQHNNNNGTIINNNNNDDSLIVKASLLGIKTEEK